MLYLCLIDRVKWVDGFISFPRTNIHRYTTVVEIHDSDAVNMGQEVIEIILQVEAGRSFTPVQVTSDAVRGC